MSRNLILVYNTDQYAKNTGTYDFTVKTVIEYAKRHNIDYRIVDSYDVQKYKHPKFAIMSTPEYIDGYDRVCIIDADISISDDAPNIFDAHREGYFWAVDEVPYLTRGMINYFNSRICYLCDQKEILDWPNHHYNGGVLLMDTWMAHKIFHMPPYDVTNNANKWYQHKIVKNQPYLNYQLVKHGIPCNEMSDAYNYTCYTVNPRERATKHVYFLHLAGNDKSKKYQSHKKLMANNPPQKPDLRICAGNHIAIITVCIPSTGSDNYMYDECMQSHYNYAKKYGYDYHIITNQSSHISPHWCKLDVFRIMEMYGYAYVLFVDADVYIKDNAPDIVQRYHVNDSIMVMDSLVDLDYMRREANKRADYYPEHWRKKTGKVIPFKVPRDRFINTGVMLIPYSQRKWLDRIETEVNDATLYEQTYLNSTISEYKWEHLDRAWNYTHPNRHKGYTSDDVYFVHFNVSGGVKNNLLREFFQKIGVSGKDKPIYNSINNMSLYNHLRSNL